MKTQQLFTVGWLSATHRVPPAVVESLIKAAGISPRVMVNEVRQYDDEDLQPVYAGMVSYIRGAAVAEIEVGMSQARTTEAGANV